MIDPLVSLAFNLHSNKSTYALLLGSGVSRASEIPTGWEITMDLIQKTARLEGEDCGGEPIEWYLNKYKVDPEYSVILDNIAKTSAERQGLLKGYFEPTEEEREQGKKLPNAGHKAIAQLVKSGHLKIIVTTNFDRLLENSLIEIGIEPTVISSADQLAGALPISHSGVTVIKLHGDYQDTRIKNTKNELASYDKEFNALLDRILDEYGVIVCGWSADWDSALRSAIERCPSRRFTTYWTTISELSESAKKLVKHRRAVTIQITGSEFFFSELYDKVSALEDINTIHPLSATLAAATVKRYIVDSSAKIRLRDLVHKESERLYAEITKYSTSSNSYAADEVFPEVIRRLDLYNKQSEVLQAMLVTGCYWGDIESSGIWISTLQRLANPENNTDSGSYNVILRKIRSFPALKLLYAGGLAALASENYKKLAQILIKPTVTELNGVQSPIIVNVNADSVMSVEDGKSLPNMKNRLTPISDYLFENNKELLREYIPNNSDYEKIFDRFEYILGLVYANEIQRVSQNNGWFGPYGRFKWRTDHYNNEQSISRIIDNEIEKYGVSLPLLQAGLFSSQINMLRLAKNKYDAYLNSFNLW